MRSIRIRSITERHSLFPRSYTRTPYRLALRLAYLLKEGERYGLTTFHASDDNGLGLSYPPAVIMSVQPHLDRELTDCTPFGSGLSATLAWFPLTTFNSDLLTFTILHKPSSPAGRCFQLFASASRFRLDLFGRATFSRHAASRPLPAASVTIGYC